MWPRKKRRHGVLRWEEHRRSTDLPNWRDHNPYLSRRPDLDALAWLVYSGKGPGAQPVRPSRGQAPELRRSLGRIFCSVVLLGACALLLWVLAYGIRLPAGASAHAPLLLGTAAHWARTSVADQVLPKQEAEGEKRLVARLWPGRSGVSFVHPS